MYGGTPGGREQSYVHPYNGNGTSKHAPDPYAQIWMSLYISESLRTWILESRTVYSNLGSHCVTAAAWHSLLSQAKMSIYLFLIAYISNGDFDVECATEGLYFYHSIHEQEHISEITRLQCSHASSSAAIQGNITLHALNKITPHSNKVNGNLHPG
jgi:hypothetical protein